MMEIMLQVINKSSTYLYISAQYVPVLTDEARMICNSFSL